MNTDTNGRKYVPLSVGNLVTIIISIVTCMVLVASLTYSITMSTFKATITESVEKLSIQENLLTELRTEIANLKTTVIELRSDIKTLEKR